MKKYIFIIIGISLVFLTGCVKLPAPNPINPTNQIPSDFNWRTVQEVNLNVQVGSISGISDSYIRVIKIYSSSFLKDGSLMASGAAKPGSPFNLKLSIPTALDSLYVQEILPNGNRTVKAVEITGANLNISTSASVKSTNIASSQASFTSPSIPIPSSYDVEITNNNSVNVTGFAPGESSAYGNTYKSYLITEGTNRTSLINLGNSVGHAILYVKGNYTISTRMDLNKVSVVVLPGGSISVGGVAIGVVDAGTPPAIYVSEGGTLYSSKIINIYQSEAVNKGSITANDNIDVNNASKFYNEGSVSIPRSKKGILVTNQSQMFNSGDVNVKNFSITSSASVINDTNGKITAEVYTQSNGTVLTNHHEVVATTSLTTSSGATINNFCNITTALTNLQGGVINLYGGSLWESQTFKINLTTINMFGGSMFLTNNFTNIWGMTLNSSSTDYSVFKVTGSLPSFAYAGSQISGRIEMVYSNLVDGSGTNGRANYENLFTDGLSILSKTQTKNILATSCNDGAGQIEAPPPVIVDNDGDGVQESEDFDDNDPTVAFVSYFPSETGWASYAFEDLYPWKGDYDMNDLVMAFRRITYTNSTNMVSKVAFKYNVRAAGSRLTISAAFQLDEINATNIASVEGQEISGTAPFSVSTNGTEPGVSLAVIPLFNKVDDAIDRGFSFLNVNNGTYEITPEKEILIKFSNPPQQSSLTMDNINFFIVVNEVGQTERGREVHLPSFSATTKMDQSLFAGKQLHPTDKFKFLDGMMWGIMLPVIFEYTIERSAVNLAYYKFQLWAESGGAEFPDWYTDKTGYRNDVLIYKSE
ncbi:MAG: LruC domain-containing protein [Bacteroidales bacterium]|nr:LruC domain-containing protein [Bacteroidales bacterium]